MATKKEQSTVKSDEIIKDNAAAVISGEDELTTSAQIKVLYSKYKNLGKVNHRIVSEITSIPRNTLEVWASGLKNPSNYIVTLVDKSLQRHFDKPQNNGDMVRFMTDRMLAFVIRYVRNKAFIANGKFSDLPYELRNIPRLINGKQYVVKYEYLVSKKRCIRSSDFTYPFPDNVENRALEIKKLYNAVNLTYTEISRITGINSNSLANWITKMNNPPIYVLKYVYREIIESLKQVENNADAIREMSTDELIEFFTNVRDIALNAEGDVDAIGALEDVTAYLKSTELIKPNLFEL